MIDHFWTRRALSIVITVAALFVAVNSIVAPDPFRCGRVHATTSTTVPIDFCFRTDITIVNNSGGDLTDHGVRFPFAPVNVVAQNAMDPRAWDARLVTSGNVDVELIAQDLNVSSAKWFALVPDLPDLPDGGTVVLSLYTGNGAAQRDQGIFFDDNASTLVTVPHDVTLSPSDDFAVEVVADNGGVTPTTSPAWLINKFDAPGIGYGIAVINDGGALMIRGQVASYSFDVLWSGAETKIRLDFAAPTMRILFDGVEVVNENTGLGGAGSPTTDLEIGLDYTGDIRSARVVDTSSGSVIGSWGFDPLSMAETSSEVPFTGTITDYSGNGHTATYSFGWSQSGISVSLGPLALSSASPIAASSVSVPNIANFENIDFDDVPVGSADGFLGASFAGFCGSLGWPEAACWSFTFSLAGLIAMLLVVVWSNKPEYGAGAFLMVLWFGSSAGADLYHFYYPMLLTIAVVGGFGASKVAGR